MRGGKPKAFNQDNFGCWNAGATLRFGKDLTKEDMDNIVDFLINVEKFKKSETHVMGMIESNPPSPPAKEKYIIFKRWDCCWVPNKLYVSPNYPKNLSNV
jgi:hypothetical protein